LDAGEEFGLWRLQHVKVKGTLLLRPGHFAGFSLVQIRVCIQKFPDWLGLELQMVQFSATRHSCIAILWVSLVSFAAINFCVASQRVFIVIVYCVFRKL